MVSIVGLNLALFLFQLVTGAYAFTCGEDGFYSNPDDCLKFVSCSNGKPTEFDCPSGTSFHSDRGVCDTTDLSKCAVEATPATRRATLPDMDSEDFGQKMVELMRKYKPCENHGSSTQKPSTEGSGFTEEDGNPSEATRRHNPSTQKSDTTDGSGNTEDDGGERTTIRGDRHSTTRFPGDSTDSGENSSGGSTQSGGHSTTRFPGGSTGSQGNGDSSEGSTPSGGDSTGKATESTDGEYTEDDGNSSENTPRPRRPSTQEPEVTDSDHHPIRNHTTPNPGNPSSGQTDDGSGQSSTRAVSTGSPLPPPTCPACPLPKEKTCPPAPTCPACPTQMSLTCPPTATCPPPAPKPSCPACPTTTPKTCPAAPTCPPPTVCATCPKVTEKICPTAPPCPKTTPTPPKPTCDAGWKSYPATKSCFYFSTGGPYTQKAALTACTKMGATLASIGSEAENKFVADNAATGSTASPYNHWIGYYRTGAGDYTGFQAFDGSPFAYSKWNTGGPDNNNGQEFCIEFYIRNGATDGTWNDFPCWATRPAYVCKKAANN